MRPTYEKGPNHPEPVALSPVLPGVTHVFVPQLDIPAAVKFQPPPEFPDTINGSKFRHMGLY